MTNTPTPWSEDRAPYYAKAGAVWKHPERHRKDNGTTTITVGFPVCTMSDFAGDEAAETVAALMNRGDRLDAVQADRDAQEARATKAEAEVARLRAALEDIVNPLAAFQRDVERGGGRINEMAHRIVNDHAHLQRIARLALQGDAP